MDDYADERNRKYLIELENLVIPVDKEPDSIRKLMLSHIERLIESHNREVAVKVEFLQTGERPAERDLHLVQYLHTTSAEQRQQRIEYLMMHFRIDISYLLYRLDGVSQHDSLEDLSDAQFLEVYNRLLLTLRQLRLPDDITIS